MGGQTGVRLVWDLCVGLVCATCARDACGTCATCAGRARDLRATCARLACTAASSARIACWSSPLSQSSVPSCSRSSACPRYGFSERNVYSFSTREPSHALSRASSYNKCEVEEGCGVVTYGKNGGVREREKKTPRTRVRPQPMQCRDAPRRVIQDPPTRC